MILALLASVMVVLFVLHVETDESSATRPINSGQCGPNATYTLYSSGVLEIRGSGEMYQYDTTPAPWYECRDDITKIFVCMDITKLGASAFKDCKHATELTIPITLNSVVSDEFPAFAGCCSIEKVKFTSGTGGNGYNYTTYPVSDAWYQNTPWYQSRDVLKEVNLADDVKTIGSNAFRQLNITSIVIPDSVVHLGILCFFNCTKLTDLTIPISLNSYGSNEKYLAFQGCTAVQKITFTNGNGTPFDYTNWCGDHNTELAPWNRYSDVAKTIIIDDNVTKLGTCMFLECNIKELTIPISLNPGEEFHYDAFCPFVSLEKVTVTKGTGVGINYGGFWSQGFCVLSYTPNLKSLIIEEGVTRIGSHSFFKCKIENLVLPNTLVSFGESPFYNCAIKNLTIPISLNATWLDEHPAFYDVYGIEKVDFTPGSGNGFNYAAYENMNCWYQHTPWYQCRDTLNEINFAEEIKSIGSDAFRDLHVTSLTIPNSVESLGCHAFYNMKELSSLTIPITLDSVGSTKYPAFDQDYNITELTYTHGNAIGHDYTDCVPFWNYSHNNGFTVTFDKWIIHIGDNTLSAYKFADANGQLLEPTAANLSGHTFRGADSEWLYLVDDPQDQFLDADNTGCISEVGLMDNTNLLNR